MRVRDLIEFLSNLDPDAAVLVDGYEGGEQPPLTPIEVFAATRERGPGYVGSHVVGAEEADRLGIERLPGFVLIPRSGRCLSCWGHSSEGGERRHVPLCWECRDREENPDPESR